MNREILFRGKRKDNGMWEYGNLSMRDETGRSKYYIGQNMLGYEVLPETIGQYTGLTDKNGRKIFEGDIVEFQDGVLDDVYHEFKIINRGVMAFSVGWFYITERNVVEMEDLIWNNVDFDGEVVGNIHDNPELVRKDEGNEEV